MERHGYYKKYTNISGKKYYIRILRVRCKVCGHTHAILPDFIVPYLHNPIIDLSFEIFFTFHDGQKFLLPYLYFKFACIANIIKLFFPFK